MREADGRVGSDSVVRNGAAAIAAEFTNDQGHVTHLVQQPHRSQRCIHDGQNKVHEKRDAAMARMGGGSVDAHMGLPEASAAWRSASSQNQVRTSGTVWLHAFASAQTTQNFSFFTTAPFEGLFFLPATEA